MYENDRKFYEIARMTYKNLLENEMSGTIEVLKRMFNNDKLTMELVEEICREQEERCK